MIFVHLKEVTSGHVAKRSEWGFPSSSKTPFRQLLRQFAGCDSNAIFKDTRTRLSQPVDSYAR